MVLSNLTDLRRVMAPWLAALSLASALAACSYLVDPDTNGPGSNDPQLTLQGTKQPIPRAAFADIKIAAMVCQHLPDGRAKLLARGAKAAAPPGKIESSPTAAKGGSCAGMEEDPETLDRVFAAYAECYSGQSWASRPHECQPDGKNSSVAQGAIPAAEQLAANMALVTSSELSLSHAVSTALAGPKADKADADGAINELSTAQKMSPDSKAVSLAASAMMSADSSLGALVTDILAADAADKALLKEINIANGQSALASTAKQRVVDAQSAGKQPDVDAGTLVAMSAEAAALSALSDADATANDLASKMAAYKSDAAKAASDVTAGAKATANLMANKGDPTHAKAADDKAKGLQAKSSAIASGVDDLSGAAQGLAAIMHSSATLLVGTVDTPETLGMRYRTEIQEELIVNSDRRCEIFKTVIASSQSDTSFVTALVSSVAGVTGSLVNEGAARYFSGGSAAVTGIGSAFNSAFFQGQLASLIITGIDTGRDDWRKNRLEAQRSKSLAQYPLTQAIGDAIRYNGLCALTAALENIKSQINKPVDANAIAAAALANNYKLRCAQLAVEDKDATKHTAALKQCQADADAYASLLSGKTDQGGTPGQTPATPPAATPAK